MLLSETKMTCRKEQQHEGVITLVMFMSDRMAQT